METIEQRKEKLENGGAAQGESSFIEQHKNLITKSRYGIKILNMREKVSEKNVKKHLETQLDLTKSTMANMGITQAYRLGKNPEKDTDPCPPVIIFFNNTEMAEVILNAARGEGQSRNFKENIPELY